MPEDSEIMNKMNRGAMTNIRHILYDIVGNLFVYLLCQLIFTMVFHRNDISIPNTFLAACLYMVVFCLFGNSFKLYDITIFYYPDRIVRIILLGCLLSTASVSTAFYFSGRALANREFYFTYFALSAVMLLMTSHLSFCLNRRRANATRTLLIGNIESFERFSSYIEKTNVSFLNIGHVRLHRFETDGLRDSRYLGSVEDGHLEHILRERVVDQVCVMREPGQSANVQRCIDICMELGIITRVVFPMQRLDCCSYIGSMGTYPVISYHFGSLNACEQAFKRLMDIAGAIVGLVLSAPILLAAAVAVKIDTPGPVFFTQTRVGYNGRRFKIYKLRTMTTDAEYRKQELLALNEMEGAYMFKIREDPRVTRVGAFLRKTSIDEIPQFFNVLMGEMSLVGTRPPTVDEVGLYERSHWKRLRIKPGITGLWQISGRNEITSFDDIVELDTQYIEKWSILSDIRIILYTVAAVLKGKGAS